MEAADEEEKVYATKEELAELKTAIEEIKAIIEKQEMSKVEEAVEEKDLELSAVEKVKHNPEAKSEKALNLYSQNRGSSTMDKVLSRITNINK